MKYQYVVTNKNGHIQTLRTTEAPNVRTAAKNFGLPIDTSFSNGIASTMVGSTIHTIRPMERP